MKRSQLKIIANSKCKEIYRKQRSLVVNLGKAERKKFLNSLSMENDSEPFWKTSKPFFFKKKE